MIDSRIEYELPEKSQKFLASILAKQMFQGHWKIRMKYDSKKGNFILIEADAIHPIYVYLHRKEVGYIIDGRMLDLLNTLAHEHLFSVSTEYYTLPDISEVRAEISIYAIY